MCNEELEQCICRALRTSFLILTAKENKQESESFFLINVIHVLLYFFVRKQIIKSIINN